MQRQGSPLRRSNTEAALPLSRMRPSSPPPQPPNGGRPRSPREGRGGRFARTQQHDAGGGGGSEPASPATSPRRGGKFPTAAAAAIAVYEEGGPVLSSSHEVPPPPSAGGREGSGDRGDRGDRGERGERGTRGGGSNRHHGAGEGAGRLEREHRDLVRAFGEKCEQLRASHAALSGVELRLAQMEAAGASDVMRQRLEAAEAAAEANAVEARAERQRFRAREAELSKLVASLEAQNGALKRELEAHGRGEAAAAAVAAAKAAFSPPGSSASAAKLSSPLRLSGAGDPPLRAAVESIAVDVSAEEEEEEEEEAGRVGMQPASQGSAAGAHPRSSLVSSVVRPSLSSVSPTGTSRSGGSLHSERAPSEASSAEATGASPPTSPGVARDPAVPPAASAGGGGGGLGGKSEGARRQMAALEAQIDAQGAAMASHLDPKLFVKSHAQQQQQQQPPPAHPPPAHAPSHHPAAAAQTGVGLGPKTFPSHAIAELGLGVHSPAGRAAAAMPPEFLDRLSRAES